jgi:SM-20-related protein
MSTTAISSAPLNLFLRPNFLDCQTCVDIRRAALSSPTTQAPVYIPNSTELVHETIRKTTSFHPVDEIVSDVHQRLLQQKVSLERHFGRTLSDCERPQFLHYRQGDFFVRHQDGNTEQSEFDHLRIRRISIVVYLNDFSVAPIADTFSGGLLNFYQADDVRAETPAYSLEGTTGLLVAFAADTTHEVSPITWGERFTIISWFR